MKQDEETELLS